MEWDTLCNFFKCCACCGGGEADTQAANSNSRYAQTHGKASIGMKRMDQWRQRKAADDRTETINDILGDLGLTDDEEDVISMVSPSRSSETKAGCFSGLLSFFGMRSVAAQAPPRANPQSYRIG